MAHQILFTSLPRTLRGGSGYGIAAQTPNVPNVVSEEITKLAGYVEIYPGKDPNRRFNPINYFFYKFNSWYILGRIISAENDYSGRFNYLGQFFVLEQNELQECGPAAILKDLPFIDAFQGEARTLPPFVMPRCIASNSSICKSWEAATGDAGWGGFLAEKIRANQTNPILYDKSLHGTKALALIAESLNLLSPAERWGTTFSTHVEGFPKGNQVRVRMLQQGGDLTREWKSNSATLDLTKGPLELGTESGLITEARTGERPSAVKEQLLRQPETVVVVGQTDFDNSGPIGLAVEAGMPEIPGQKSKNWVATPPNLTPPKMGKQKRINYSRDTDEFKTDSFLMSRESSRISYWVYTLAGVAIIISFGIVFWLGTYVNRMGLEETQQNVEDGKGQIQSKDQEIEILKSQVKEMDKKIKILNKKSDEDSKAKIELIKNKDADIENLSNKLSGLNKHKKFIVAESGLVKSKTEDDEVILKEIKTEIKKLQDFYKDNNTKENAERKELVKSLLGMPKEFISVPKEIDKIGQIIIGKNIEFEKLSNYDKNLKKLLENNFNAKSDAVKESSLELEKKIKAIYEKQEYRAENIKNNLILSNIDVMVKIFGESGDKKKDIGYFAMDKDWFEKYSTEICTPNANCRRNFLDKCAIYFLELIKKDEIFFTEDGKFIRDRFIYLKNNGKKVQYYINQLKDDPKIKDKGNEIDKFNKLLLDVFNIKQDK